MFNRRWIFFLLFLLPLLIGVLASFGMQVMFNPVPILLFRIDIGMVTFLAGLFISVVLLSFLLGVISNERRANKLIDDSLRESEQGRQRFLRRLDHEIKNPLTGLRAALVNLQESGDTTERQRASEHAGRAVERLTRLLTDLRKLSDLEERSIERRPVDVPDVLEDVVDAARSLPAYQGRNINLFISKVPSLPAVTGDRDLLVLAVYNLVENALKFTSAADSLEVRALEDGKAIVIEVADSGTGISSEDQSKIFEELYRGSNARSTEGSGLGLALVNRIIALHGGAVTVRSNQSEPRGTVFTVRLPVKR
ncbi:MAG TPA: HAMP domain-containing sensor histidine kinase [Anaerolineales bacterium]|nr:HAMP domain-containing sensor histidine kinase [Anaerolineales bacterium]